jgi:hypothetical protein
VRNLTLVFQAFLRDHNGQMPVSWDELNAYVPLADLGTPSIQERYTLASNAPISEELDGGQVLAIGRIPFSDDIEQGIGRFLILRTKEGEYRAAWRLEDKVQKIIAETHLVVPSQTVPQPAKPSYPPHEPMTREQYETLKRSDALPLHQEIPIIDSSNSVPSNPTPVSSDELPPVATSPKSTLPAVSAPSQIQPISDTGIPSWIYGIILLSMGCIAGVWFFFLREKR